MTSKQLIAWFDEYMLLILSGILLVFIPLYPKLPLFDLIEGYLVRARLEDILLLFTGGIWLLQIWRKKITYNAPLLKTVVAYALVGLASVVSAIFYTQSVPLESIHIGKTALHYFRYLEYFSLFFILYTTIKNRKQVVVLFAVMLATLLLVVIYGYGQKFWYWPVYSTMNREFSKGIRLYLTEHARVQSTFGGHYDMAAYLVLIVPFVLAASIATTRKTLKPLLVVLYLSATWLLVVSGSRSSFVGFLLANITVIFLLALQKDTFLKKSWFAIRYGAVVSLTIFFMMLVFGQDMYDRFLQTLAGYPELDRRYHLAFGRTKTFVQYDVPVALGLREENIAQITKALPKPQVPKNGISTDDAVALVASDQRPVPTKPQEIDPTTKPRDVYVDVPDKKLVATTSATGEIEYIEVEQPRTYSANAQNKGLSEAIRLDSLWPQAIRGFLKNPLLGSGYATLNKDSTIHFTEAESTDNNFLRTLGETGLLGFISFYAAVVVVLKYSWGILKKSYPHDWLPQTLAIALIAGSIGLLINSLYIDIFAASKVAMTYWAVAGLVLALGKLPPNKKVVAPTVRKKK